MKYLIYFFTLITFFLISCGTITSTGTRYHNEESSKENKSEDIVKSDTTSMTEDVNITPSPTKIEIPDTNSVVNKDEGYIPDVWYNYDTTNINSGTGKLIKQEWGYRVLVLTTDNLDEANTMKSEIYFKTDQKPVYISFDPPFYKVKAGDFVNSTDANEFGFKLNQMGYTECKIIRDTVNIFQ
jgi:hypothetical protein